MKIKKFQNSGVIQRDNTRVVKPKYTDEIISVQNPIYIPNNQGEINQGKKVTLLDKFQDWYNATSFKNSPMASVLRLGLPGFSTVEKLATGEPVEEYEALSMFVIPEGTIAKKYLENSLKWGVKNQPVRGNEKEIINLLTRRAEIESKPFWHNLSDSEMRQFQKELDNIDYKLSLFKGNSKEWNSLNDIVHRRNLAAIDKQKRALAAEDALYNDVPNTIDHTIETTTKSTSGVGSWHKFLKPTSTKELHYQRAVSQEKYNAVKDAVDIFALRRNMKESSNAVERAIATEAGVVYGNAKKAGLPFSERAKAVRERILLLMDNPEAYLKQGGILKRK